jgi:streptomycin 6-kinase
VRAARDRLARRHSGPAFDAWWDALPRLTRELARRWNLELGEPIPRGNTSLLVRCTRDGRAGVLKLSPELELAADEARALRAWAPTGRVPAVWEHEGGALLLEAIVPGTVVERAALTDIAALLEDLHAAPPGGLPPAPPRGFSRPPPGGLPSALPGGLPHAPPGGLPPDGFPPLSERVEFVYDLWIPRCQGVARADLDRARELALELAASYAGPAALVHGDLHPGNVLLGSRGLVAVDPRACAGDPAFDAIDWVLWHAEDRAEVERRAHELAADIRWITAFAPLLAGIRIARGEADQLDLLHDLTTRR